MKDLGVIAGDVVLKQMPHNIEEIQDLRSKLFGSRNSDFEIKALEIHNVYRREHGAPPLVLSKDLCKISQSWADELAKKDEMSYSLNDKYGESVFCGWAKTPDTKVTAQDCVEKWYSEINDFSFGREPEVLNCGHFTQIVWKTTKQLGIGRAKSKSGKIYIVANYYPPGNYSGQFSKNVPPPGALQFSSSSSSVSHETNTSSSPALDSYSPHQGLPISKNENTAVDLSHRLMKLQLQEGDQLFEKKFLEAHNDYRRLHGVPPLRINEKINAFALEWATKLAEQDIMKHREQDKYGENIFYAWSTDPNYKVSAKEPVDKWYSEIKDFKFGYEPTDLSTGHFTQLIWKKTKEVGVGVAKSKDGKVYVVANYHPPGNVLGFFKDNVPPPSNK